MTKPSWQNTYYVGGVRIADELEESDLSWLCGCGLSKPYVDSKAYPVCECGQRMRILNHARLGYVTTKVRP